jgi:steroid delta-isomerase-like uncharacterized protein
MATSTRSGADVAAVVMRIGDELWSEGNVAIVGELYAEDCMVHSGTETFRGHDGVSQWVLDTREAFPDLTLELGEVFATEEFAAATWHMTGTHDGYMKQLRLEPTGERVNMSGVVVARFEDGKCVEEWGQGDQISLLAQLGLLAPSMD